MTVDEQGKLIEEVKQMRSEGIYEGDVRTYENIARGRIGIPSLDEGETPMLVLLATHGVDNARAFCSDAEQNEQGQTGTRPMQIL